MRGDLHTLRRICEYGSKTMVVGEFVLIACLLASIALTVCSMFSENASVFLSDFLSARKCSPEMWIRAAELIAILMLAVATVNTIRAFMTSVSYEHSPFTGLNTDRFILLSKIFLFGAVVLGFLEVFSGRGWYMILFMFFGCILVSVVVYCLGLMIRYGNVLQDEYDHTL